MLCSCNLMGLQNMNFMPLSNIQMCKHLIIILSSSLMPHVVPCLNISRQQSIKGESAEVRDFWVENLANLTDFFKI
jgi:hypothetical protein